VQPAVEQQAGRLGVEPDPLVPDRHVEGQLGERTLPRRLPPVDARQSDAVAPIAHPVHKCQRRLREHPLEEVVLDDDVLCRHAGGLVEESAGLVGVMDDVDERDRSKARSSY
jgi:hypothetical protein